MESINAWHVPANLVRRFLVARVISSSVCMECLIQDELKMKSEIWTSLYIYPYPYICKDAFRLGATGLVSSSELLPVPPAAAGHV